MFYLLCLKDGLVKKYPLNQAEMTLGRRQGSDICLEDDIVSRIHARIRPIPGGIEIEDIDSANGVYVDGERVKKARIEVGSSFRIGRFELFLKEGNPEEFTVAREITTLVRKIEILLQSGKEETTKSINRFDRTLTTLLRLGLRHELVAPLVVKAGEMVAPLMRLENMTMLVVEKGKLAVLGSWPGLLAPARHREIMNIVLDAVPTGDLAHHILKSGRHLYVAMVHPGESPTVLAVITPPAAPLAEKARIFLKELAGEMKLILGLIELNQKRSLESPAWALAKQEFVTLDEGMAHLIAQAQRIAPRNISVVVEGETGTGKEVLARYIHLHSGRDAGRYVAINCAAIPENLLEDELFGHEKGAFTGAVSPRKGKLEMASGGTLVLDEIGDMSLNLQAKLLRVIEEREFYRVGGNHSIRVDLRLVALTHRNLREMIAARQFREDLYYRLSQFTLHIPPLREHRADIKPLVNHFFRKFSEELGVYPGGITAEALRLLEAYDWPGNVRELENQVRSLVSLSEEQELIGPHMLRLEVRFSAPPSGPIPSAPKTGNGPADEHGQIRAALEKCRWNKGMAAKELGISRSALYNKMRRFGVR